VHTCVYNTHLHTCTHRTSGRRHFPQQRGYRSTCRHTCSLLFLSQRKTTFLPLNATALALSQLLQRYQLGALSCCIYL
jgi:hypothetical protein